MTHCFCFLLYTSKIDRALQLNIYRVIPTKVSWREILKVDWSFLDHLVVKCYWQILRKRIKTTKFVPFLTLLNYLRWRDISNWLTYPAGVYSICLDEDIPERLPSVTVYRCTIGQPRPSFLTL